MVGVPFPPSLNSPDLSQSTASVASSRKATKPDEPKGAVDSAARQARLEEADTFRGVHLDPNAHHWDEVCLSINVNFSARGLILF